MKQRNDETINVGTESWNVAEGYTKLKILKQLVTCDRLETIAIYGVEDIDQQLEISPDMIIMRRIDGIKMLKDNLKQLFSNVSFAIKKEDKNKFQTLREIINLVEDMIDSVYYTNTNHVSKQTELVINEKFFSIVLNELQHVKEMVNIPINSAGLIFRSSEEIDFETIMKQLSEDG